MRLEEVRTKKEALELQILAKKYIEKKKLKEQIKEILIYKKNEHILNKKFCVIIKELEEEITNLLT